MGGKRKKSVGTKMTAKEKLFMIVLLKTPLEEWVDNDVCCWLSIIGCSKYVDEFLEHQINGVQLVMLDGDILNALGVKKRHIKELIIMISELKNETGLPKKEFSKS